MKSKEDLITDFVIDTSMQFVDINDNVLRELSDKVRRLLVLYDNWRASVDVELVPLKQYSDYHINKEGEVYSTKQGPPKRLSTFLTPGGYQRVRLCLLTHEKIFYTHRLVAETFIPNPLSKPEVNHIDGNRINNNVDNLEWVTHVENIKHATANRPED